MSKINWEPPGDACSTGFDLEWEEVEFSLKGLWLIEFRDLRFEFFAFDFDGLKIIEEDLVESSVSLPYDVL